VNINRKITINKSPLIFVLLSQFFTIAIESKKENNFFLFLCVTSFQLQRKQKKDSVSSLGAEYTKVIARARERLSVNDVRFGFKTFFANRDRLKYLNRRLIRFEPTKSHEINQNSLKSTYRGVKFLRINNTK
jgi:hypothetical protein